MENAFYTKAVVDKELRLLEIPENPFGQAVEGLIGRYFGQITSDREMLEKAFCTDQRRNIYSQKLRIYFQKLRTAVIRYDKNLQHVWFDDQDKVAELERDLLDSALKSKNKTIIVLGKIGSGKSTFIRRFFDVSLHNNPELSTRVLFIYVDLLAGIPRVDALEREVELTILDTLRKDFTELKLFSWSTELKIFDEKVKEWTESTLKPYYDSDVKEYKKRLAEKLDKIKSNMGDHILHIFKYLIYQKGIMPCLVIDNSDQFDEYVQKKILQLGFHKANWTHGVVFVILRGRTFMSLQEYIIKSYRGIESRTYEIEPPNFSKVLQKRIDYLLDKLRGSKLAFSAGGYNYTVDNVSDFLGLILNTLVEIKDDRHYLIHAVSEKNIGNALDLLLRVIESGHVPLYDYISLYKTNNKLRLSYHHILTALMLGKHEYYCETLSCIKNIFDSENIECKRSPLLLYRMLSYLCRNDKKRRSQFPGERIVRDFSDIGYPEVHVDIGLKRLFKLKLVHTWEFAADLTSLCRDMIYFPSDSGHYYFDTLIYHFAYLQRVIEDTYLPFNITLMQKGGNLSLKIHDVKKLYEYVVSVEDKEELELRDINDYVVSKDRMSAKIRAGLLRDLTAIIMHDSLDVDLDWLKKER